MSIGDVLGSAIRGDGAATGISLLILTKDLKSQLDSLISRYITSESYCKVGVFSGCLKFRACLRYREGPLVQVR